MLGFGFLCLLVISARAGIPSCPNPSSSTYDFIVVGAGAGGGPLASRLVESGFSVLLVDAGHDVVNFNTTVPTFSIRSTEDPQTELNYTYQEYPASFHVQRNNQWYPRARALGGSTVNNAMVNLIANTRRDFDGLATTFDDPTWSRDNMQDYFRRIEHNVYITPPSPDHGFNGWLKTSSVPLDVFARNPAFLDAQLSAIVTSIQQAGPPLLDMNDLPGDGGSGVSNVTFTVDENHVRSSIRERLQNILKSKGPASRLHFLPDTLATKILLCNSPHGTSAYGVEIAPGAALPVASNFNGKKSLKVQTVTARHEIIVSTGVFQSPQLLMLSGIGDAKHLREHGIKSVVDLPGVGSNLQDNDEIAVIWRLKNNHTLFNGCTFLSDPSLDPCLKDWLESGHENLYAFPGAVDAVVTKSSPNDPALDILTYFLPAFFPGYFRGVGQLLADNHNALTAIVLKGHSSSKGTVRLTGNHPQDLLNIQKQHFQAPGGPADIVALREGIKRARKIVSQAPLSSFVESEVSPGPNVQTDADIDQYILEHVFGHHACCTNPMGPKGDMNAVLDGDFNVRGVSRLRVVDVSSWPIVPGFFINTPTYMISEKAADVIIEAARKRTK